jgi:hypothetical protein
LNTFRCLTTMAEPTSADELQPGTVIPTHGRTMKEQKAWFLKKAEEARKNHLAAAAAAAKAEAATAAKEAAAARKQEAAEASSTASAPSPSAVPKESTSEPVAIDVSEAAAADANAPTTAAPEDDGLSEGLRALSLAGGDLASLSALAVGESASTDLALSLKQLGFKGLQTRKRLEADLKAYHAAQSA